MDYIHNITVQSLAHEIKIERENMCGKSPLTGEISDIHSQCLQTYNNHMMSTTTYLRITVKLYWKQSPD